MTGCQDTLGLLLGRGALETCEAGMRLCVSILQNHVRPCRRRIRKGEQGQPLSGLRDRDLLASRGLLEGLTGKVGRRVSMAATAQADLMKSEQHCSWSWFLCFILFYHIF